MPYADVYTLTILLIADASSILGEVLLEQFNHFVVISLYPLDVVTCA